MNKEEIEGIDGEDEMETVSGDSDGELAGSWDSRKAKSIDPGW